MTGDTPRTGAASDNPASRNETDQVVIGSGNVFADLGLPNPEAELRAADARIAGLGEPIEAALAKLVRAAALAADRHGPGVAEALQAVRDVVRPSLLPAEMTPAICEVLGLPNFRCGPIAEVFRAAGHSIRPRSESEQAFVLFRFLHLALQHGPDWFAESCLDVTAAKDVAVGNLSKGDVP